MAKKVKEVTEETEVNEAQENSGTPLQQEKEAELADMIEGAAAGETPAETVKRKKRKKKKVVEPESTGPDLAELQAEGEFLFDMVTLGRKGLGIEKQFPDMYRHMFISGYRKISEKYGAIASKYMPEIMFGSVLALMAIDTLNEVKILKESKIPSEVAPQAEGINTLS